jgi:uncharacterized iron-regulated membrane protein
MTKTIIKALAANVIIAVVSGTALWIAIDVASFYTENQFTGKMKAYDAHLINCIGASLVMVAATTICKTVAKVLDLNK